MTDLPEDEADGADAIAQLKRLIEANLADPKPGNIKVTFKGRFFFGDYYISAQHMKEALK